MINARFKKLIAAIKTIFEINRFTALDKMKTMDLARELTAKDLTMLRSKSGVQLLSHKTRLQNYTF